jgi:hypothetical protein
MREVLTSPGTGRLARKVGVLRRGSEDRVVLDSGASETPVIVLAPHTLVAGKTLLADMNGTAVVWEGDQVELAGGIAPEGDPRYPAFLAWIVSIID